MKHLAAAVFVAALGAGAAQAETVVDEAKAFMEAYGRDLAKGDREAVAARYDRTGAFFLVAGGREFSAHPAIVQTYRQGWTPPQSFEWRDLQFDVAGADAVVVNGRFLWGTAKGVIPFTYTGFLRRQDGELRIRLEDETPEFAPAAP